MDDLGFKKEDLLKLANTRMPFGRFKGKYLLELPEPYLVWFSKQGFPDGEIGLLLKLALEVDMNGLKELIVKLKK